MQSTHASSAARAVLGLNGLFVLFLAVVQVIPLVMEIATGGEWAAFAISGAIALICGGGVLLAAPITPTELGLRHALGFTVTAWLVLAVFAALPFVLTTTPLSPTDAFFESMSGVTTTGATAMTNLDSTSDGILMWRALLQWIGGIGIILTAIAILPAMGVGGMQLFLSQQTGSSDRLTSRSSGVALGIFGIYVVLTLVCAVSYNIAGMSPLDSWAHAFTTVASGGYSTHDQSAGYFDSNTIYWLMIVFMMLSCLPYGLYVSAIHNSVRDLIRDEQVRAFVMLWLVIAACIWIARVVVEPAGTSLPPQGDATTTSIPIASSWDQFTHTVFSVTAIITTTGYATTDYSEWGGFAVATLFFVTFMGGCAGSGTCGLKTFRIVILWRAWWRQIRSIRAPNAILNVRYAGSIVENRVLVDVFHFACLFVLVFGAGALTLNLMGLDAQTALSGSAAAVANVGPGLGPIIGPSGTYAPLPDAAKWVLCALMLLGRLELVTLLLLLSPQFWRRYG